jgi:hypothetical protein
METGVVARILVGFLSDVRIPVIRICDLFSKASNYFAGSSFFRTGTSSISRESVPVNRRRARAPCVLLRASRTLRRAWKFITDTEFVRPDEGYIIKIHRA